MSPEGVVLSYEDDDRHLHRLISSMGNHVDAQLNGAMIALCQRDDAHAVDVIKLDQKVDLIEQEIEQFGVELLAGSKQNRKNKSPQRLMRRFVFAMKVASELERMGDFARNIAKRAITLNRFDRSLDLSSTTARNLLGRAGPLYTLEQMADLVRGQVGDAVAGFLFDDTDRALRAWEVDEEVDQIYNGLFRELLTYMMESPVCITPSTHLLFIAKNLERVGDHATNMAEAVHYTVKGEPLTSRRAKADDTHEFMAPIHATHRAGVA